MKTMKLVLLLLILVVGSASPDRAEAQYTVRHGVFGSGGAATSNSSHRLIGTVGQPLVGRSSSASHSSGTGFWYLSGGLITSVEHLSNILPTEYRLEQNYPNPFNPETTIRFVLPKRSSVTLKLFDILGKEVATLVDEELQPGEHKVVFDARSLSSGVYFYRLEAKGFVQSKRFLLLK